MDFDFTVLVDEDDMITLDDLVKYDYYFENIYFSDDAGKTWTMWEEIFSILSLFLFLNALNLLFVLISRLNPIIYDASKDPPIHKYKLVERYSYKFSDSQIKSSNWLYVYIFCVKSFFFNVLQNFQKVTFTIKRTTESKDMFFTVIYFWKKIFLFVSGLNKIFTKFSLYIYILLWLDK